MTAGRPHTTELAPLLVDKLEAARLLSVSPSTLETLWRSGELLSVKIGARRLYDVADLRAFIAQKKGGAK